MDTRHLGYVGLGMLVGIVGLTLLGVGAEIWIPLVLVGGLLGLAVVHARASGTDLAERVVANGSRHQPDPGQPPAEAPVTPSQPQTDAKPVDVELVREADGTTAPAVWLHRCGGRRVHRYQSSDGWTVEQVSTKDPDNPRKRVIGEPLGFAREVDAVAAADGLARGLAPHTSTPTGMGRSSRAASGAGA